MKKQKPIGDAQALKYIKQRCKVVGGHWIWRGPVRLSNDGTPRPSTLSYLTARYVTGSVARAAWIATGHAVARGRLVLSKCDVSLCVNPAHAGVVSRGAALNAYRASRAVPLVRDLDVTPPPAMAAIWNAPDNPWRGMSGLHGWNTPERGRW